MLPSSPGVQPLKPFAAWPTRAQNVSKVTEQRGHVPGQQARVEVALDVGRAAVPLELGRDHPPPRRQLAQHGPERQLDGLQPAGQQHQRPFRPTLPVHLVVHPQPVDRRVSAVHPRPPRRFRR
jgi:hypothetical protein